MKILAIE